jgi:hypothetical protein|tara:strand:+ start:8120 stop:8668 length:549 start_codon:yes stop_codon:yes gene_type:complete
MAEVKEVEGLTLSRVHDYQRVEGKIDEVKLVNENHYIRLSDRVNEKGEPDKGGRDRILFAQNGQVWTGEGTPALKYNEIPEWFWVLARKCSKEGRDRVGLVLPEEEENHCEVSIPKYDCPEKDCMASVPLTQKGIHIGMHTRKRNAGKKKKTVKAVIGKEVKETPVEAAAKEGIVYKVEGDE